jgi:hypothetical protein
MNDDKTAIDVLGVPAARGQAGAPRRRGAADHGDPITWLRERQQSTDEGSAS